MPLLRQTFPVGALGCNCTIVSCPDTKEALVIDPGDEAPAILDALAAGGLRAVKIVHTHAHFDHVMATGDVAAGTGADVLLHKDDRWLYDNAIMQTQMFGLARPGDRPPRPPTHAELAGDEAIGFGRREVRALHTPGHTPGSLCLYFEEVGRDAAAVRGRHPVQGVGRPHGPVGRLAPRHHALHPRPALTLPDATLVIPGHGPETTVAGEREDNPFVGRFAR